MNLDALAQDVVDSLLRGHGNGALIADPDAATFARRLGFEPDEWQTEFLNSEEKNILLNCSRQSGKSTVNAIKALYTALIQPYALILLLPMLAVSGGRLGALSTPFGRRGWWFEQWEHGENWQRFEVPAKFLEATRKTMGQWWFDQEFMCKFMDAETAAFSYDDVMATLSEGVETWNL